jgi:hypothetical protein
MKNRVGLFLAAAALLCLFVWTGQAQKEPQTRTAWEYTTTCNAGELNRLGAEGWELVGISVSVQGSVGGSSVLVNGSVLSTNCFYFKRAK